MRNKILYFLLGLILIGICSGFVIFVSNKEGLEDMKKKKKGKKKKQEKKKKTKNEQYAEAVMAGKAGTKKKGYGNKNMTKKEWESGSEEVDPKNLKTKYNTDNLNVEYHKPEEDIKKEDPENKDIWRLFDSGGKEHDFPAPKIEGEILYQSPDTFPYGSSNYVPTYEDSVYLSRTTNETYMHPYESTETKMGGFCAYYKNKPMELEKKCNQLEKNVCASSSCCVLLGGSKCVAGKKNGPYLASNYSDRFVRNKDFYYYNGKCYGNCGGSLFDQEVELTARDSDVNPIHEGIDVSDEPAHEEITKKDKYWKLYDAEGNLHIEEAPEETDL